MKECCNGSHQKYSDCFFIAISFLQLMLLLMLMLLLLMMRLTFMLMMLMIEQLLMQMMMYGALSWCGARPNHEGTPNLGKP